MKKIFCGLLCFFLILATNANALALEQSDVTRFYNNEPFKELYSLDYESRTYQRILKDHDIDKVLKMLKEYTPPSTVQNDKLQKGFLIFTDKGKHTVYLPGKSNDEKTKEL